MDLVERQRMAADPRDGLGLDLGHARQQRERPPRDRRRPAPSAWRRSNRDAWRWCRPARGYGYAACSSLSFRDLKKRSASGVRTLGRRQDRRATRKRRSFSSASWRSIAAGPDRCRPIRPPARRWISRQSTRSTCGPASRCARSSSAACRMRRGWRDIDIGRIERRLRHVGKAAAFEAVGMHRRRPCRARRSRVDHLVDRFARHLDGEGLSSTRTAYHLVGISACAARLAGRGSAGADASEQRVCESFIRQPAARRTSRRPRPRCSSRARRRARPPRGRAWPDRRSRRRPASTRAPRRRRRSRCPGPWRDAAAGRSCRPGVTTTVLTPPAAPPSTPCGPVRPWSITIDTRRLAAAQPDRVVDAEAAAELAGAARALAQRVLLEQHRIELLQHLDRRHLGDADGRAAVGEAVAARAAAVAAAGEEVHDVVALALGVVAADAEIAAGAGGRGEQQVGDRLGRAPRTPPRRCAGSPRRRSPTPAADTARTGTCLRARRCAAARRCRR